MKASLLKLVFLITLLLHTLEVTAMESETLTVEPDLALTTLKELGHSNGYTFEGLQADHEHIFHFPVAREVLSGDGELIIDYRASPHLDGRSMIRVDVNGAPQAARHLGQDSASGRIKIALRQEELQRFPYLNVTVKASLLVDGDRCMNDRLRVNYLHLLPASGLRTTLQRRAGSLRGAWERLPKRVRISLPGNLSIAAYKNVLNLGRRLLEDGKQVEFVRLPHLGELVIASRQELEPVLHQHYLDNESLREQHGLDAISLPADKDAYLLQLPDRQVTVFSEPYESLPTEFFAEPWWQVALGREYAATLIDVNSVRQESDGRLAIPLDRLGLDLSPRYVSRATDWYLPLSPLRLAGNLRPETLHLDMVSSPSDSDTPLMLQIFLNGILQQVSTLPNDGLHHQYRIHLSAHDYKPGHNELHVRVQRNLISGDCHTEPPPYPVQLTAESYLIVNKETRQPSSFHDLHALFADGLDLYVPAPDGQQDLASLAFLSNLFSHNDYPLERTELHFLKQGQQFTPDRPFILLGEGDQALEGAGVRFDRGAIQVANKRGETLLDVDRLPRLTITQIATTGDQHGLWILAREGSPMPVETAMVLENNSVAFSDERGILLTLNPRHREVSLVDYPQYQAWFDHLGRYRFWLLALGWLLLTLLVVQLYGKARKHRQLAGDK
jgi:hypothetical protein